MEILLLCFITVIWGKIFSTFLAYTNQKQIPFCSNTLMKCIKFHLLAPTGISNILKEYIIQALKQGFLMPKEYNTNIYAKNAILMFSDAYKFSNKAQSFPQEFHKIDFIISHINIEQEICDCDLIDLWDIDLSLSVFEKQDLYKSSVRGPEILEEFYTELILFYLNKWNL